jgi:hypothetical protein
MPARAAASPAVLMVCTPRRNVTGAVGNGSGSQRSGAGGIAAAGAGAVSQSPASSARNLPQWLTVGRMGYSQLLSLAARGAVNAEPLSCSA